MGNLLPPQLVVLATAVIQVLGSTWGLSTEENVFTPLAGLQNIVSSSYHQFLSRSEMTGFSGNDAHNGFIKQILANIEDTYPIPALRFDFHFDLDYDYIASWLTDEMFGFIETRQGMLAGVSEIKDEFSFNFLNTEGDFEAVLFIQTPSLLISGNYETNITNYPYSLPTPDQEISGGGSYNLSFNLVKFELQVQGRAALAAPIMIHNVEVSLDFTNPTSTFSNLTLKTWSEGWGGWDTITYHRMIQRFTDIPQYFSWNLDEFSVFLDFQKVADEVFRCSLQNAFNNCSLMDLLVSTECVNKTINTECVQTDIFELNFLDESAPYYSRGTFDDDRLRNNAQDFINAIDEPNGTLFKYGTPFEDTKYAIAESLAVHFWKTFHSDDGLYNQLQNTLSLNNTQKRELRTTINEESAVDLPAVDVDWRWRSAQPDWLGGSFKAWGSSIIGFNGGQKTISTQFLDQEGTFSATYNVTFPFLNVSGNYDTDITIYNRAADTPGDWVKLGEGKLYGAGEYHWNLRNVTLSLMVRGSAPMFGKMSLSEIVFEMIHADRRAYLDGATFTNLTNLVTSFFGNISMEVHPENWKQLYSPHRLIFQTFLYDDNHQQFNPTFEDVVADHLLCAINYAIQDCSILDLIISDDCLRLDRNQSCFDGKEMTVRQPSTWSSPIPTENSETSIAPTMHTTQSSNVTDTIETTTEPMSSTTESSTNEPVNPVSVRLLLNQTQLLLDQAQMLLGMVQASV